MNFKKIIIIGNNLKNNQKSFLRNKIKLAIYNNIPRFFINFYLVHPFLVIGIFKQIFFRICLVFANKKYFMKETHHCKTSYVSFNLGLLTSISLIKSE